MTTVSAEEVLLLWRALGRFRAGRQPGCAPHGRPPQSDCPLYERCPRWHAADGSADDDWALSLEEDPETTARRRGAWPCSRLLDILGPETQTIGP
jgi:hypothetical protein